MAERRLSVRSRLTVTFLAVLAGSAVVLVGIVVAFMALVPDYVLEPTSSAAGESEGPPVESGALQLTDGSDVVRWLVVCSVVALVVVLVVGALVVRRAVGRALQPLTQFQEAAHVAATGDVGARIDVTGPADEVSGLGSSFNAVLERLQRSLDAQRRFAANASHELQTPLATTQALIDVALVDTHEAPARELLGNLRDLNTRSVRIVRALLDLADAEHAPVDALAVPLADVVRRVVVAHADEAAGRDVDLRLDPALPEAEVVGDPVLTELLVRNVVANAVRHNIAPGWVEIGVVTGAQSVELVVTNTGPVLTETDVAKILEPFHRGRGRTSAGARTGSGLGGALIAGIADRHGWVLDLAARAGGGLTVRVCMPAPGRTVEGPR